MHLFCACMFHIPLSIKGVIYSRISPFWKHKVFQNKPLHTQGKSMYLFNDILDLTIYFCNLNQQINGPDIYPVGAGFTRKHVLCHVGSH